MIPAAMAPRTHRSRPLAASPVPPSLCVPPSLRGVPPIRGPIASSAASSIASVYISAPYQCTASPLSPCTESISAYTDTSLGK